MSAERDEPLIRLVGVTKTYGEGGVAYQALRGIDLEVAAGEFVAIMGSSGSGKSTVMNILGCLDTPTSGAYLFRGIHVEQLDRNQRALLRRHSLGFVFQGFNLLARTSAQENVELPLLYRGESATQRREHARAALASVGSNPLSNNLSVALICTKVGLGGQPERAANRSPDFSTAFNSILSVKFCRCHSGITIGDGKSIEHIQIRRQILPGWFKRTNKSEQGVKIMSFWNRHPRFFESSFQILFRALLCVITSGVVIRLLSSTIGHLRRHEIAFSFINPFLCAELHR